MQAACTQPSRHGMGQVAAAANAYDRSGNCIHQEAEVEQDEKGDSPLVGQVEDGSEPVSACMARTRASLSVASLTAIRMNSLPSNPFFRLQSLTCLLYTSDAADEL